jgi:DNA polymerase-3 subunit beta
VILTAQTLVEILRSIESDEVRITTKGRNCEIVADDARYKLVTEDPQEFPDMPFREGEGTMIPRVFLEEMFSRTAYAAARDVGRYAINGILLELGEHKVRMVATDGRRLAVASRELPEAAFAVRRAIVPIKGLQECLRGSEGEERVSVLVHEDQVTFATGACEVSSKPVEGEFPDYAAVIPREFESRTEVERDALFAAVKKVSVMAGEDMRAVRMKISAAAMEVSAEVEGRGEARTSIEAQAGSQKEITVDFNPDYVADFLKPLPAHAVALEFRDNNSAVVFRPASGDDLYVLMPITTN